MKKRFLAVFVFMFLFVSVWIMAENEGKHPVAVSPGSETGVVIIWQSCPTFSWSSVEQAASYRIAVFESIDANVTNIAAYETLAAMASPAVSKDIPGPALSWTLPAEEKLKTGGQYTWYVQALDANGNALGAWSNGRIFKVEQEVRFAGVAEKLGEVLKSYGMKDETITNVLADMKSEVQEVVVNGAGGKEAPGISGIKGLEGASNTFYGQNAGASITTGSINTFVGAYAGYADTTGNGNTLVGNSAGYNNISGYCNISLGAYAGYSNTTGYNNAFLGYAAGVNNTIGYHNIFLGRDAGYTNSTGDNNIFLGYNAGFSNTTADYSTFIGNYAGYSNTTGLYNTFIGYYAGYANTTANGNTCIGYYTGKSNSTGHHNCFIGDDAGYSNTTGYSNNFLGTAAGYANTTGRLNNFIGYYAGNANTTGNANNFLGYFSGAYNTIGTSNTFLGYFSGYANDTGSYNTFIGNYAGKENSAGNSNIFIGYNAGYNETGSNKLYISNTDVSFPLIYGDFSSSIIAVNGKLGVGRQAPSYPIHMASGAYCSVGGTWTNASSRALKENIENLSIGEAVETLTKLNPVKYNYRVDKADKHVGFIAEDVPDLVASTDRKGLSPMDITAVLTKVVQELKRENQEQQDLIQEQQRIISGLQERMARLEKK